MSRPAFVLTGLLFLALVAGTAQADRVLLKNGGSMTGRILSETEKEIVLQLENGMKLTIRRSDIDSIERREEEPTPEPEPAPEPEPVRGPGRTDTGGGPKPGRTAGGARLTGTRFFEGTPEKAWNLHFARYPILHGARLTRFRAYEYVAHEPLALPPTHEAYQGLVRRHGHGGSLAVWTFQYVGNLEIRHGDEVRFIGEITSPPGGDIELVRLKQGPTNVTERIVVLLIRRQGRVKRLATTTIFDGRDVRQADLKDLPHSELPVRTFDDSFTHLATAWLKGEESEFLDDIRTPFGNSLRVRLERYRFRLKWMLADVADRPDLDPDLIRQNVVAPLARPGGPVAKPDYIRRMWGTYELNRNKLRDLLRTITERLSRISVRAGGRYYVEQDRIGMLGKNGVTIETRRHLLDEELLESLTKP